MVPPSHRQVRHLRSALLAIILLCTSAYQSMRAQAPAEAAPPEQPPNIVLIMADDLGYGDLGSYGQERIHTPNLDRLAREGMRFTQFYSGSTVCAPSRSVLMTGQHTGHTPIRGNKEIQPIGQAPLPASSRTVAEVLADAGYRTGAFGKWGLGGPGSEGMPSRQGFDTFFGYLGQRRAHFYYPEFLFRTGGERVPLEGNETAPNDFSGPGSGHPIKKAVYSHDRISEEALQFIEDNQDERFFLYVPSTIPHTSLQVPESSLQAYLNEEGESIFEETPHPEGEHYSPQEMPHATYAAMISRLDREVGRIMSKLKELGLDDNTLILFTSDNGPQQGGGGADAQFFNSAGSFRGDKGALYEGGIRVPLIAWWPGQVRAGTESDHIGYLGDFMATFADLANTSPPDSIDSISLLPTLLGHPAEQKKHDYLYWEFPPSLTQAVRMGKWKAVRHPMLTGDIQLYNLQKDAGERSDVSDQRPEVVEEIRQITQKAHTPSPLWAPEEQ